MFFHSTHTHTYYAGPRYAFKSAANRHAVNATTKNQNPRELKTQKKTNKTQQNVIKQFNIFEWNMKLM